MVQLKATFQLPLLNNSDHRDMKSLNERCNGAFDCQCA